MKITRLRQWSCTALAVAAMGFTAHANDAAYRQEIENQVRSIMLQIMYLEKIAAPASEIAALQASCDALCEQLATPPSRNLRLAGRSQYGVPPQTIFGTPPPDTTPTTTDFLLVAGTFIANNSTIMSTINVSGLDPYLWDLDLGVSILHAANQDLDVTLTSPAGTVTTITTDNGGTNDNVFGLTTFDDDATQNATDNVYSNNTVVSSIIPEGAMAAFVGEDPNGNWKLTITDDASSNVGFLTGWRLRVTTVTPTPANAAPLTFTQNTPLPIPANNTLATSTVSVSTPGTCVCDVDLQTFITHTWNSDLQFSLRSPAGTVVVVSTNNGGGNINIYNGTHFDDDVLTPVTDAVNVNNVVTTPVTPESAFGAFLGEDPNGTWTLEIRDTFPADVGTVNSWNLKITTCAAPTIEPFCFGDGSGTECPCHNNSPLGSERGCRNGLGVGAKLTGIGSPSVSTDDVQLMTEDTPFLSYVLYWQSRYTPNMGFGSHFDDGLLCTQTPVLFLGSRFTNSALETHFPETGTPLSVLGNIPPEGGTRFIQCWYRNAGYVCGTENNLTNGVKLYWVP